MIPHVASGNMNYPTRIPRIHAVLYIYLIIYFDYPICL
jgi:hypothetical protein